MARYYYRCRIAVCKIEAEAEAVEEFKTDVLVGKKTAEVDSPNYKQEFVWGGIDLASVVTYWEGRTKCGLSGVYVLLEARSYAGQLIDITLDEFETVLKTYERQLARNAPGTIGVR